MPAEKGGRKPQPETTTLRVHLPDGQDISELAAMENRSAADVYRDYCSELIRQKLKERMQNRLKDLK